jgi:hypothetical protein
MCFMEGLSKLALLVLVVLNIEVNKGNNTFLAALSVTQTQQVLALWTLGSLFVELGLMEEKGWSVTPSIAVDPAELTRRRKALVWGHPFCDVWKTMDTLTLLPLVAWAVMVLGLGMDASVSSISHAVFVHVVYPAHLRPHALPGLFQPPVRHDCAVHLGHHEVSVALRCRLHCVRSRLRYRPERDVL